MQEQPGIVKGIRIKVLIGFGIILLAVAFAAIINFISLNELVSSVKTLSAPDEKMSSMRKLMGYLSNEESSVRAYTLTRDERYLLQYQKNSDSVHSSLARLKQLAFNDPDQFAMADSLTLLVAQREVLLNQFIENRQAILKTEADTPEAVIKRNADEQTEAATEPLIASEDTVLVVSASDENKVWNWIKNLNPFKKKKGTENENEEGITREESGEAGRAEVEQQRSDSVLLDANMLLLQQEATMKKQMADLTSEEAAMVQRDKNVMDRIRFIMLMLENNQVMLNREQAEKANSVADKATLLIKIVGALGILSTLIFLYLILTDITRSNRLRLQLMEERSRAEQLAKVKEDFLANMSHEIRTPLNAIVGFAEQLSKENAPEKQNQYQKAIQSSSEHLLSIVNQVLDFSKIESGKLITEETSFDFHELVRKVHETFKMKAAEKEIWFSYRIDESVPQVVMGDELSMKQILINLVSNALKFTNHGGITINCFGNFDEEGVVKITTEVKDTGIGIAPFMQERIFDEFTQSDHSITRKYGGTGLGLTITRKLTNLLKGTIEVSSKEGSGSVFSVTIPFKKSFLISVGDAESSSEPDYPVFENQKVLIVDDEEMNLILCETILKNWGLKTETAHNGKEALGKAEQEDYHIILLDLQMPQMSGIDVVKHIRSGNNRKSQIPIIALTANAFSHQHKEFSDAGFSDVVIKPFKQKELYDKIKKLLSVSASHTNSSNNGEDSHTEADKLYSLEYLEKTSGSNHQFIVSMLQSFINNNTIHLRMLDESLGTDNWEMLSQVAHKMIPSYRYLRVKDSERKLKQLENIYEENMPVEKISALVQQVKAVTLKLFELLREDIRELQNINGHQATLESKVTEQK